MSTLNIRKLSDFPAFLYQYLFNVCGGFLLLLLFSSVGFGQTVTTGSLVEDMIDLEQLVEHPEPFYRNIQFSSYDRRSDEPDGPGWLDNSDGFGNEPIPNFEEVLKEPGDDGIGTYLLCDIEGPGAIVRGWTAAMEGELRVYLDESDTPIFEDSPVTFFQETYLPFLEETKLDTATFEQAFLQRDASYFPIPYSDHLRVEWTGDLKKLHFYEIQTRKYEKDTDVRTFEPGDLQKYAAEIEHVSEILDNPDSLSPEGNSETISAELTADVGKEVFALEEEAAIQELRLKVDAENVEKALRQTVLNIRFDGSPKGQVEVPVGDFFGAAPGINPYVSLPFTVQSDGTMISRFVMPFKDSVQVHIENKGDQQVQVEGSVAHKDYDWDPDRSMHFRARWRIDHNIDERSPYDLPFVIARGKGLYVGTSSILKNPIETPTAGGNWWGEGDEKIFVDDDTFPSIFGTGSEDYYNYSWSSSDIFQTPYTGQPRNDGPDTRGFVTNHRWHVLDPIPFKTGLQFFMEFFTHTERKGFSYARTSYFYSRPGLIDDHVPISEEDVRYLKHDNWSPKAEGAASNSVFYQVEELVEENNVEMDLREDNLWAEGELFVWYPQQAGDELDIPIEASEVGKYRIWVTAAKIGNSGDVSIRVNEEDVGFGGSEGLIDLNAPDRKLLRNYASEELELEGGEHTINVQFENNDAEEPAIGLDFVWIQKMD